MEKVGTEDSKNLQDSLSAYFNMQAVIFRTIFSFFIIARNPDVFDRNDEANSIIRILEIATATSCGLEMKDRRIIPCRHPEIF